MCAAAAFGNIGAPAARALPVLDAATETAFRKEYGDNPTIIAETGIHTWGMLQYAAIKIREAAAESP